MDGDAFLTRQVLLFDGRVELGLYLRGELASPGQRAGLFIQGKFVVMVFAETLGPTAQRRVGGRMGVAGFNRDPSDDGLGGLFR
ncbi:hypothetical protein D3C81_1962600 [compost metagenome]